MSPATTIDNNQGSPFAQVLEELKSAPTGPGTLCLAQTDGPTNTGMKDAKAAADKLARQISKAGLQSLEYVLSRIFCRSNLDVPMTGMKISLKNSTLLQTTRSLDMNENPPPSV